MEPVNQFSLCQGANAAVEGLCGLCRSSVKRLLCRFDLLVVVVLVLIETFCCFLLSSLSYTDVGAVGRES